MGSSFQYKARSLENGKITYDEIKIGEGFKAARAEAGFSLSLFPPYCEVFLSFVSPKISSDQGAEFLLPPGLIPTNYFGLKLDMTEGSLPGDFSFTFISGEQKEQIGTLIVYDEKAAAGDPLLFAEAALQEGKIKLSWEMGPARLERMKEAAAPFFGSELDFWGKVEGEIEAQGECLLNKSFEVLSAKMQGCGQDLFLESDRCGLEGAFGSAKVNAIYDGAAWDGSLSFAEGEVFVFEPFAQKPWQAADCRGDLVFGKEAHFSLQGILAHSGKALTLEALGKGELSSQDHYWLESSFTIGGAKGDVSLCQSAKEPLIVQIKWEKCDSPALQMALDFASLYDPRLSSWKVSHGELSGKTTAWLSEGACCRLLVEEAKIRELYLEGAEQQLFLQEGSLSAEWAKGIIVLCDSSFSGGVWRRGPFSADGIEGSFSMLEDRFSFCKVRAEFQKIAIEASINGSWKEPEIFAQGTAPLQSWFSLAKISLQNGFKTEPLSLRLKAKKGKSGIYEAKGDAFFEKTQIVFDAHLNEAGAVAASIGANGLVIDTDDIRALFSKAHPIGLVFDPFTGKGAVSLKDVSVHEKKYGLELTDLEGEISFFPTQISCEKLSFSCGDLQASCRLEAHFSGAGDVDLDVEATAQGLCPKLWKGIDPGRIDLPEGGLRLQARRHSGSWGGLKGKIAGDFSGASAVLRQGVSYEGVKGSFNYDIAAKACRFFSLQGDMRLSGQNYRCAVSKALMQEGSLDFDLSLFDKNEIALQLDASYRKERSFSASGKFYSSPIDHLSIVFGDKFDLQGLSCEASLLGIDREKQSCLLSLAGFIPTDLLDGFKKIEGDVKAKIEFSHPLSQWSVALNDLVLKAKAERQGSLWNIPFWEVRWKEMRFAGLASFQNKAFAIELSALEGWLGPGYTVCSLKPFILSSEGFSNVELAVFKQGKLAAKGRTEKLCYLLEEKTWQAEKLYLFAASNDLKEPIEGTFRLRLSPEKISLQGVFDKAFFQIGGNSFAGKELVVLYQKPQINVKLLGNYGQIPVELKGRFFPQEKWRGAIALRTLGEQLRLTLQMSGQLAEQNGKSLFQGVLEGKGDCSYISDIETILAKISLGLDRLDLSDLAVRAKEGDLNVKQLTLQKDPKTGAWSFSVPLVKGSLIRPNLIQAQEANPFVIRNIVVSHLQGIFGNRKSYQGQGVFHFTNALKKEPSFFDPAIRMLKDLGLDLGIFTPVVGEIAFCLKDGKIVLTELKNSFSEGRRSEFFLDTDTSFIDFGGNISIDLTLRQNVLLKIAKPFSLSIRGSLAKPHYFLR